MTLTEAIDLRISSRSYLPTPITPARQAQLQKVVDRCCQRSGLHIGLVCGRAEPFDSMRKHYGLLKGVQNYIYLAGPSDDPHLAEKCGYFGEEIVLTATSMGLGTCWVGGTYDKHDCLCHIAEGETLVCVIAVGHVAEEKEKSGLLRRLMGRRVRSADALSANGSAAPDWFAAGMAAVTKAPSSVNRQPYRFRWTENGVCAALTARDTLARVDLGIAKFHFELGAHGGSWEWGDNGSFRKAAEEKSCGAVIWQGTAADHRYLLACHNGGHWSFPKGHVENDETEVQTARREILEETGLEAEIDTSFRQVVTYYPKPNVIKDVIFFLASPVGGTEQAQEAEIARLGWFTFEEARRCVTFATDEEVLLAAEAYLSSMA